MPSPSSPPKSSHKARAPSLSNTMHWLSRTAPSSSATSTPYAPSKPMRISEPKLVRAIDILSPTRNGSLGSGATVVRTPDEALRETGVRLTYQSLVGTQEEAPRKSLEKQEKQTTPRQSFTPSVEPLSPPTSPPLPPLPLPESDEEKALEVESPKVPARPSRTMPPPPIAAGSSQSHSRRSSLKGRSISIADDAPTVPPLPPHIAASNQPPPFSAILISDPPLMSRDPSQVIVTVETCTTAYKTTLQTINSRPSHLSDYLSSLYYSGSKSAVSSVYSTQSDDMEAYRHHLSSQGLVPRSANIHIFLDRPSAPYPHILAYLRAAPVPGQPELLPHSLQRHISTHSRLESLVEVRDEAAFLNLEGLHKLCTDEIRIRYGPRLHVRSNSASSGGSIHSLHASVYSLHNILERVETDLRNSISPASSSHDVTKNKAGNPQEPARSPATPQSWDGPLLDRQSQGRQSPKNPPAGWI
ncbi:hypothetical protein B0H34DRAFT_671177 [Crassisporium funariophilum]|nr:hypothetical protein B0H34DRAFT_671177 [Crassisporium funariophilum]